MTREEEIDQFENNFHTWLEQHGVSLGNFEERKITASIDLNVLKPAIMQLIETSAAEKVQEYENDLLETLDDISNKPWRAIRHIRELYEKNVRQDPDWYEEVARDYMLLESFYSNGGANKIEELLADPTFNINDPDLQAELSKLKEEK